MPVIQGDNEVILIFRIKDNNNAIVDLTGSTVKFRFKKGSGSVIEKNCTNTSATNGQCQVVLTSSDLDTGNTTYTYQISVEYSDGRIYSSDQNTFYVKAKLA